MLSRLIRLLSQDVLPLDNIASKMGVGQSMARQLLFELVRLGYVEHIDFSHLALNCQACKSNCRLASASKKPGGIWMLTGKGIKAAKTL